MDEELQEETAPNALPETILEFPLQVDLIVNSLGLLLKSLFGEGYIYTRVDLSNKKLTDIETLKWFRHLFYVNISKNYIENIDALEDMQYLLTLNGSFNRIKDFTVVNRCQFLTEINLERNQVEVLPPINVYHLTILNLNNNKISSLTGENGDYLIKGNFLNRLELRGNSLTSTLGLNLPKLVTLYLANNKITDVVDLPKQRFLQKVHLRDNNIEKLDGFLEDIMSLTYVNLRNNKIADPLEIRKMANVLHLSHLVLKENPMEEDEDYRLSVLRGVPHLIRLDKDEYEDDDREQIKEEVVAEEVPEVE